MKGSSDLFDLLGRLGGYTDFRTGKPTRAKTLIK
jgi:hypothetical protein